MPRQPHSTVDSAAICDDLLQQAMDIRGEHVALFSAAIPGLIRHVQSQGAKVTVFDHQHSALMRLRQMFSSEIRDTVYTGAHDRFHVAVMLAPKGRDLCRAQLWSAYRSLPAEGRLYIAGPTKGGIKSLLSDAGYLFGQAVLLDYRKRHRVALATKITDIESYPAEWGSDPTQVQARQFAYGDGVQVGTMPGVFSWQSLDDGSRFLLESGILETLNPGDAVLDMGCGTGIIGILAHRHGAVVTFADDNLLAVQATRHTIDLNARPDHRPQVIASDVFSSLSNQRFNVILSNPPFHQSFAVDTEMPQRLIAEAPDHLQRGGRLVLVANAFLRYDRLMADHFKAVNILAESSRYHVIEGSL